MKIEMNTVLEETIEEFADHHGLVMEVHERPSSYHLPRYWASFKYLEVGEPIGFLAGVYGDGMTPEEAIRDYANKINGKRLLYKADGPERQLLHLNLKR